MRNLSFSNGLWVKGKRIEIDACILNDRWHKRRNWIKMTQTRARASKMRTERMQIVQLNWMRRNTLEVRIHFKKSRKYELRLLAIRNWFIMMESQEGRHKNDNKIEKKEKEKENKKGMRSIDRCMRMSINCSRGRMHFTGKQADNVSKRMINRDNVVEYWNMERTIGTCRESIKCDDKEWHRNKDDRMTNIRIRLCWWRHHTNNNNDKNCRENRVHTAEKKKFHLAQIVRAYLKFFLHRPRHGTHSPSTWCECACVKWQFVQTT